MVARGRVHPYLSQGSGAPAPPDFESLLHAPTRITPNNQVLHGGQTIANKQFTGSTTPLGLAKNFITQILTRHLVAVANFLDVKLHICNLILEPLQ